MRAETTYYAPSERANDKQLESQIVLFETIDAQGPFSDALPLIFLILNVNRQIIYANQRVLEKLGEKEFASILGKRVGEAFHCIHATEEVGGCGTSRYCENCGAVNAMLESQTGIQSIRECRLSMEGGLSADYQVWATPHEEAGEIFTFFTLQDIQHEKRRKALESTFFHDILNTAGGISGLTNVLNEASDENEKKELLSLLNKSSQKLIEEIQSGQALSLAEDGKLELQLTTINLTELIKDSIDSYRKHPTAIGKQIKFTASGKIVPIHSDRAILGRVISNLIRNALEASNTSDQVTIDCTESPKAITITVHNNTSMSPKVKAQVFERSFSTKGEGRGIGTYSIRLFTEKYLNGTVSFTSNTDHGTSFYIKLKKTII